MNHDIAVIPAVATGDIPTEIEFTAWATAALPNDEACDMSIRIVDDDEGRQLNKQYRGRDQSTNVLSFPADLPAEIASELPRRPLGDLAICAPVVTREAADQGKLIHHHWAHLTVHGVLHLLGHNHEEKAEAELMESREREILAGFGVPDPYA